MTGMGLAWRKRSKRGPNCTARTSYVSGSDLNSATVPGYKKTPNLEGVVALRLTHPTPVRDGRLSGKRLLAVLNALGHFRHGARAFRDLVFDLDVGRERPPLLLHELQDLLER